METGIWTHTKCVVVLVGRTPTFFGTGSLFIYFAFSSSLLVRCDRWDRRNPYPWNTVPQTQNAHVRTDEMICDEFIWRVCSVVVH